jgi:hypothetical protein
VVPASPSMKTFAMETLLNVKKSRVKNVETTTKNGASQHDTVTR